MPLQYGSLEIGEDMDVQRRTWRAERIGWLGMLVVVLAALLGVFSTGPLSSRTADTPAGDARVRHDRFLRHGAPAHVRIDLLAPPAGGEIDVRLSYSFLESIDVENIHPRPLSGTSGAEGVRYRFAVSGAASGIFISGTANGLGPKSVEMTVGDARLRLPLFIYP